MIRTSNERTRTHGDDRSRRKEQRRVGPWCEEKKYIQTEMDVPRRRNDANMTIREKWWWCHSPYWVDINAHYGCLCRTYQTKNIKIQILHSSRVFIVICFKLIIYIFSDPFAQFFPHLLLRFYS